MLTQLHDADLPVQHLDQPVQQGDLPLHANGKQVHHSIVHLQ